MTRWLTPLGFALIPLSCGGEPVPEPVAPEAPTISSAERYMPLKNDTVYSYATTSDTGEQGILTMRVTRPREGRADLVVGGKVERLEIVPDGIRRAGGGYLLKAPISVGAEWKDGINRFRVTSIDKSIQVPAGNFTGCVETIEESGGPGGGKKVTSVYCPDVGMVLMNVEAMTDGEYGSLTAELKYHGPPVDIATFDDAPAN